MGAENCVADAAEPQRAETESERKARAAVKGARVAQVSS